MRHLIITLALLLSVGAVDLSAQNFLENLGRNLQQTVKKEVKKAVNKEIGNIKEAIQDKQKATDVLITNMQTWLLVVKDGKPHYEYIDDVSANKENYFLYDVKYEHPDGVEPFTYTTAVATFKAKDGYYFNKSLKLNNSVPSAENTVKFKVVDSETVKVYLTAFTGDMGYDIRITDAMKEYKNKISTQHLIPVATAQLNVPLYDYWQSRLHGAITKCVEDFAKKHLRTYYAYPTTEEVKCVDGTYVSDGKKKQYGSEYTIRSVDILDIDLSDDIPGLVGEWCLVDNKRFLPKSCLKDITSGSKNSNGAPAVIVDSPFLFAGGNGTFEDPYLIQTAEQLNAVRKGPQNHYKLIADIDLSEWGNWVPIGGTAAYGFLGDGYDQADQGAYSFQGSFDGNGHVISGMQIVINEETPYLTEGENWRAYGLFANIATNPVEYKIKNLGVVNFNIDVNYTNVKNVLRLYTGAICGGMNHGTDIYNCYSKGGKININVRCDDAFKITEKFGHRSMDAPHIHIHAGGLCSFGGGHFLATGIRKGNDFMHIEKCFNDSDITVKLENCDYELYGAGIIGAMGETHIHECYNSGNITLPLELEDLAQNSMTPYAAGICAFAFVRDLQHIYHYPTEGTSFIQNCYNSGQIIGREASGVFHVSLADIHLENCYNTGLVIGNEFDHASGGSSMNDILSNTCAIIPYGKEYVRNCTTDGNAVTGAAWQTSSTLGRKILAAIPEDTHHSNIYNVDPGNIGTFTDVKADIWYADAVQWAFDKGIVSGTTFSPKKTCTRAQLMTYLWIAAGSPKASDANPFSDVKATDSYYDAALWASQKGIISGNTFAANTALTRGELVISLWKSLDCPEGLQVNQYDEIESHQSDFGRALAWSHVNSVMGGTDRYKFSPKKTCTKADVINFLHRALK